MDASHLNRIMTIRYRWKKPPRLTLSLKLFRSLSSAPPGFNYGSAPGTRFPFTRACGVDTGGKYHRVSTKQRQCVSTLRTCGNDNSDGWERLSDRDGFKDVETIESSTDDGSRDLWMPVDLLDVLLTLVNEE